MTHLKIFQKFFQKDPMCHTVVAIHMCPIISLSNLVLFLALEIVLLHKVVVNSLFLKGERHLIDANVFVDYWF